MKLRLANEWRQWFVYVVVGFLFISVASAQLFAQATKPTIRADLEKVANQSTVEVTTIGRKSGKPHTKPIWFVYDQGRFYIQSGGGGKSDWYLNLKKTPQATLKLGELTFSGKAKFIDDPTETERIHGLFSSKYLRARLASLVGSQVGHGRVVEVELPQ